MENNFITIKKAMGINPLGLFSSQETKRFGSPCHQLTVNPNGDWSGTIDSKLWEKVDQYIKGEGHKAERFPAEARLLSFVIDQMGLEPHPQQMINAATSRGSIDYLAQTQQKHDKLPVWTSPHSTLGFASSWPGLLHASESPLFFQSSTCSSFGLALQNAFAWLNSGMADQFIAAAVECPTGELTIDQMKAIRIYAPFGEEIDYPCRSMDFEKSQNTMVLGEGAYAFELSKDKTDGLAVLKGVGSSIEKIHHSTQLSATGDCIVGATQKALEMAKVKNVDMIIGHFPGTKLGDLAEKTAYERIFGENVPYTISNKWKIGHSLGSSLAANLDQAISIFNGKYLPEMPSYTPIPKNVPNKINHILITALGFGGQAISAVVSNMEG